MPPSLDRKQASGGGTCRYKGQELGACSQFNSIPTDSQRRVPAGAGVTWVGGRAEQSWLPPAIPLGLHLLPSPQSPATVSTEELATPPLLVTSSGQTWDLGGGTGDLNPSPPPPAQPVSM